MAIIGSGDIATVLKEAGLDRDNIILFASGVSNSRCSDRKEFTREWMLLLKQPYNVHLVYFSTLAIYYGNTFYTEHKKLMEELVQRTFETFTIVRIGNITWGANPKTIINFFKNEYFYGRTPELMDEYRYLISKEEFIHWMKMIPVGVRQEMNITGEMISVKQIWERIKNDYYR